jgi:hypothetical protein
MVHLWIHLLGKANHKPKKFMFNNEEVEVLSGQFITGRKILSAETSIKESKIQEGLKFFEKAGMIQQLTNNRNRLITITYWKQYQQDQQPANSEPTTGQHPADTNKNDKNDKNEENEKNLKYTVAEAFIDLWNSFEGITKRSFKSSAVKEKVYNKILARHKVYGNEGVTNFFNSLSESNHIFSEAWFNLDYCVKSDDNFEKVTNKWMEWKKLKNQTAGEATYDLTEL